ncbi:hypothetical protein Tco_0269687 [Tanacetum coccineum]
MLKDFAESTTSSKTNERRVNKRTDADARDKIDTSKALESDWVTQKALGTDLKQCKMVAAGPGKIQMLMIQN